MVKQNKLIRTREKVLEDAYKEIERLAPLNTDDKYYYDIELAKKYVSFVSLLKLTAGEFAGINFQLLPFQVEFLTVSLCVLNRETKLRRYKQAVLFLPRKNAKSELMAALVNLMLFVDNEKGKEIYCIAVESQQAQIVFNAAVSMLRQTNYLDKLVNIYKSTKSMESKGVHKDIVKVLSSNAGSKDGLRCSTLIADECGAYKDDSLFKVVEESQVSRQQPISFLISTAGYSIDGFFYQKIEYAKKVKAGIIKDDSFYSMLFYADPKKWDDEEEWIRCNPLLGYGVKIDNLRDMYTKALHSGTEKVSFLTKFLNIFTSSSSTFINDEVWQENMGELPSDEYLRKLPSYGGLDLSSVSDLTAFVLIFIDNEKNKIYIKCKTYLPSDNLREKARNDEVPYQNWVNDGFLTLTSGNVVDYDYIQRDIEEAYQKYKIKMVLYDRWNSHSIVTRLMEKRVNMVAIGLGFASMSSPTKMLEKLSLERKLVSNDPILRWCISNMVVDTDPSGNIKPNKDKGKRKIDVAVALIMALGGYIPDINKISAYASRGIREL